MNRYDWSNIAFALLLLIVVVILFGVAPGPATQYPAGTVPRPA